MPRRKIGRNRPRQLQALCGFGFAIVLLCSASSSFAVIGPNGEVAKPFVIKGQAIIQLTPDVRVSGAQRSFGRVSSGVAALDAVFTRHHVSEMRAVFPWRSEDSPHQADRDMSRFQVLLAPEDTDLDLLIDELMQTGKVVTAEKNWAVPLLETAAAPNDPDWGDQYSPTLIGATSVWDVEPGSDTAKIAMIDSGVNYKHSDLKPMIWVNPGEDVDGDGEVYDTDDLNGVDDDGNGVIDDLIGYDFFTGLGIGVLPGEDGGGPDTDPNDFDGHGTHCAGNAAAATNNAIGVAGIAGGWHDGSLFHLRGPRIMCLRAGATGSDGLGYVNLGNCASAIDYAARNGADVVNCSWGSSFTSALSAAIVLALDSGVVISKAAGNDGADNPDWMAGVPGVISVASVDDNDAKSGFSNFGDWVEIAAPGGSIYSTNSVQYVPTYGYKSGTSMAAPAYCGAVLLLKSLRPDYLQPQLDSVLLETAHNIDAENPGFIGMLGSGRVDIAAAIQDQPVALFSAGPATIGNPGLTVDFTDLSPNTPSAWSWTFGDGGMSSDQNPSHTYNSIGVYDVTLEATEPNGVGFEQAKRLVLIHADTIGGDTAEGLIGGEVVVPVYLNNEFPVKSLIIPLKYSNANGGILTFSHISNTGLVTEDWEFAQVTTLNTFGKELVIDLRANIGLQTNGHSTYLPPGSQHVVNVHFDFDPATSGGAIVPITSPTVGGQSLSLNTLYGAYPPEYVTMYAKVSSCCDLAGDADNGGSVNIGDATFLIQRIFNGGPAPDCADEGDADGSNSVNIADVTYIIQYIFNSGPAPVCGTTGL